MNNKGMTLVELIVTFALLLVIVVGMFNLIMDVKLELDNKQIAKDFTEYSSTMANKIQYDFVNSDVLSIAYKNSSGDSFKCYSSSNASGCSPDESSSVVLDSDSYNPTKLDALCKGIYPCIVYSYDEHLIAKTRVIGLNINPSGSGSLSKYGIYYDNVFEAIPDGEYVEFRNIVDISNSDDDEDVVVTGPEIKYENELFVIDFPFYLVDNDTNYGFKIVVPFKYVEPSQLVYQVNQNKNQYYTYYTV